MNPNDLTRPVVLFNGPIAREYSVHLDNGAVGIGRITSGDPDTMIVNLAPFAHRMFTMHPNEVPTPGKGITFKKVGGIVYQHLTPDNYLISAVIVCDLGWVVSDATVDFVVQMHKE